MEIYVVWRQSDYESDTMYDLFLRKHDAIACADNENAKQIAWEIEMYGHETNQVWWRFYVTEVQVKTEYAS